MGDRRDRASGSGLARLPPVHALRTACAAARLGENRRSRAPGCYHGKRSGFYSDFTIGVWRGGEEGPQLTPVGKAYFGFTDEELSRLDKFVRDNTIDRFGPVRSVRAGRDFGLVLEIAFEGLQRSTRHKSGVAMRFSRINRIRWDKPALEADTLSDLKKILVR